MGSNWNVDNTGNLTTGSIGGKTVANVASATTEALAATSTPTASTTTQWDANKNLSANNSISGYTTTATAAGTTTLTVSSAEIQYFTGSTTQTVKLPVTSTLVLGQQFLIQNRSTGVVTVQSSGSNTIKAMEANTQLLVTCILITGTTAASWDYSYAVSQGALPVDDGGTGQTSVVSAPAATAWAGWDANKNLSANSFIDGYTTTATAAGTTTLTVGSTAIQYFTGSTTQNVKLPVTSTLVLGQQFIIENRSTGVVTVESSGTNSIIAMASNTQAILTCILITGTTAASWDYAYNNVQGATYPNASPSNGQIPIGNGTNFVASTITAGSNVTVTNGAGTITISATSSGGSFSGNAIYVSRAGNDTSGTGTIIAPYASVSNALTVAAGLGPSGANPYTIIILGGEITDVAGQIELIPYVNIQGQTAGTVIDNGSPIIVNLTSWNSWNDYGEVNLQDLTIPGGIDIDFSTITSSFPSIGFQMNNVYVDNEFIFNGYSKTIVGNQGYLTMYGCTLPSCTLDNCIVESFDTIYGACTIGTHAIQNNSTIASQGDTFTSFAATCASSGTVTGIYNILYANIASSISISGSKGTLNIDALSQGTITPTITSSAVYNVVRGAGASIAWTPGYTGFSANPTATAVYQKIGRICNIYFTTTGTGTSNATTFTITGLPFTAATATTFFIQATNAGSTAVGYGTVAASGTTITLSDALLGSSGWTASGAKGASFQFFYETTT